MQQSHQRQSKQKYCHFSDKSDSFFHMSCLGVGKVREFRAQRRDHLKLSQKVTNAAYELNRHRYTEFVPLYATFCYIFIKQRLKLKVNAAPVEDA